MSILNLSAKYLPNTEGQLRMVEHQIDEHRAQIADGLLQAATIREMLPLCKTDKVLTKEGVTTTEKEQYAVQLQASNQSVALRRVAVDKLLPEYERLKALKEKLDAEKAEAEEAKRKAEAEAEEAKRKADEAAQAAKEAKEATPDESPEA